MAVGRKTGGRQKGTRNKRTQALQAEVEAVRMQVDASGMTPLDFILAVMRDPAADPALRFDAAKAAAPYIHPRLAAVEHTGADRGPIQAETRQISDIEAARWIGRLLTKAAATSTSPATTPTNAD